MCRLCIYMHNTLPKRTYMHHANINRQWIESGSKYFHKENLKARRCMMNKYCHRCGNEISLPSTGLAGNTCRYPSIGLASGFFGLKYPSAVFWGHQPIFNWIFEVCDALRLNWIPRKLRLRRNFRWMFAQSKSSWAQEMNFCAASARKKTNTRAGIESEPLAIVRWIGAYDAWHHVDYGWVFRCRYMHPQTRDTLHYAGFFSIQFYIIFLTTHRLTQLYSNLHVAMPGTKWIRVFAREECRKEIKFTNSFPFYLQIISYSRRQQQAYATCLEIRENTRLRRPIFVQSRVAPINRNCEYRNKSDKRQCKRCVNVCRTLLACFLSLSFSLYVFLLFVAGVIVAKTAHVIE